jgi:glutamate/tyrosine decarboxylase-like PLP-dependent enzyme
MVDIGQESAAVFQKVASYATDYRSAVEADPPRPLAYANLLRAFEAPLPETGDPAMQVVTDLVRLAEPGLHATTGPRFFGWVIGASHPVGVAADWLTSVWGQNAGNHTASPAAAASETVSARWLIELLGLPREASVGFVTGATIANFVCLAAARGEVLRRVGWDVEARGLFGAPPITVLIGADAHATVFSALQFLGLGHERVVRVATGEDGTMVPAAFAEALHASSGPTIAVLQAGQMNTGAFDPFRTLIPEARARGAWVHVDGAFGLWARAAPGYDQLADGVELADSWATDGHKWLQTPYDSGYAIVRDAQAHRRAMTIAASYLPAVSAGERDPSHFVPELSRRARGFATWAMMRHLGRDGIATMVADHCRLARRIADELRTEPGIHVMNDVVLNQIVVRFGDAGISDPADRLTIRTIERIQSDGVCFMGGTRWRDRWMMRISVISGRTTLADEDRTVAAIRSAFAAVKADASA